MGVLGVAGIDGGIAFQLISGPIGGEVVEPGPGIDGGGTLPVFKDGNGGKAGSLLGTGLTVSKPGTPGLRGVLPGPTNGPGVVGSGGGGPNRGPFGFTVALPGMLGLPGGRNGFPGTFLPIAGPFAPGAIIGEGGKVPPGPTSGMPGLGM